MQETHLKKVEKTEIFSTLRSFGVGESECILTKDSGVDISVWRSRYGVFKKQGLIKGTYRFHISGSGENEGTLIMRES